MNKRLFLPFLLLSMAMVACGGESVANEGEDDGASTSSAPAADAALETDDDKTLYALGFSLSQQLAQIGISEAELAMVYQGLRDGVNGSDASVDMQIYGPRIQMMAQARMAKKAEAEATASADFLAEQAALEGVQTLPSGLLFTSLVEGTGANPPAGAQVKVHYHGSLRDGTVFDSSVDRGEPIELSLNSVIECWKEGIPMMKVGGKARLVCPGNIAYGPQGRPPTIPGNAALVFEVELLEIVGN
ncbi:MAG: FKBP-type peptidyl-prolyl cis-trans isomerase [Acidobacteriota bacterium]